MAEIRLDLSVDPRAASAQFTRFRKTVVSAFDKVKRKGVSAFRKLKNVGGKIAKSLGISWKRAALGITAAIASLGFAALKTIQAANEQESATAKLEATLLSTAFAAGLTAEQLNEQANALQRTTTFGNEAINNAQSLLLTFTKIGKDVFPEATKTLLDLSTGMGQDLKQGAIQLGKALNDPIEGVAALRRVGVQLTEVQEEQIRKFVELGDVAAAQTIILSELNTQFGGQAAAQAQTFGGAVTQLKNVFGDLLEEIGFFITKNTAVITGINAAKKLFEDLAVRVKDNRRFFMDLVRNGIVFVLDSVAGLIRAFGFLATAFQSLKVIGAAVFKVLAIGFDFMIRRTLNLLLPFDLVFKGLVRIGAVASNPFDRARGALDDLRNSTNDVLSDTIDNVVETDKKYKGLADTVQGVADGMAAVNIAQLELTKTAPAAAAPAVTADTGPTADQAKAIETIQGKIDALAVSNAKLGATREQLISIDAALLASQGATNQQLTDFISLRENELRISSALTEEKEREKAASALGAIGPGPGVALAGEDPVIAQEAAQLDARLIMIQNFFGKKLQLAVEANASELELQKIAAEASVAVEEQKRQITLSTTQAGLTGVASILQSFNSITQNRSKTAFRAFKAVSIASALVGMYTGATKAFAEVSPYPLNLIAAGSIIASGLANIAKIKSARPGGGGGGGGGGARGGVSGGGGVPSRGGVGQFAPVPIPTTPPGIGGTGPNITIKLISALGEIEEGVKLKTAEAIITLIKEQGSAQGLKISADMISTDEVA